VEGACHSGPSQPITCHSEHGSCSPDPDAARAVFEPGPETALVGRVSVHPGRVVSTAGCGDSLLAGLLQEWSASGDWEKALKRGLAVATANAVNREAGQVQDEDIAEFESMAMLERLG